VLLSSLFHAYAFAPSNFIGVANPKTQTNTNSLTTFRASSQNDEHSSPRRQSFLSKFKRSNVNLNLNLNPRNKNNKQTRRKRLRKKVTTFAASLAIYSTILLKTPQPAMADHPLQNVPTGKVSLRPGVTLEGMNLEAKERASKTIDEQIALQSESKPNASSTSASVPSSSSSTTKSKESKKIKRQKQFDIDEEYDFDEMDEDEEELIGTMDIKAAGTKAAIDITSGTTARAVTRFSGSGPAMSSAKQNKETGKTVVKVS